MVLGIVALAWIVSRRVRSGDGMPSTDEVRERASEAMPDAATELVVGGSTDETSDERTERGGPEPVAGVGDVGGTDVGGVGPEGVSPEGSSVDDTMTDDEMAGRVEPDARDEPAPPGEMNVDDDVAEEVLGGEAGEGGEEEASAEDERDAGSIAGEEEMLGQDETDMEGDEDENE